MPFKRENRQKLKLALIALSYVGCFMSGLVGIGRGIIYPDLLLNFHLSDTEGSFFFSLASATGLIANLLTSKWYPRLGPIKAMTLFSALFVVGVFLVSFAPAFEVTLLGSALLGFSMSGSSLLVNILASQGTSDSSLRRQIIAGLHAAYGIASMLAPLIANAFAQFGLDWRMTFAMFGIAPLIVLVQSMKTSEPGTGSEWRSAFVDHKPWRRTLWYSSISVLYVSTESMMSSRLSLYVRRDLGFETENANFLVSAFFLVFFVGRLALTIFKFKQSNVALLFISAITSIVFFGLGLFVNPWALVFCGLGFSIFYPCLMAHLAEEMGPALTFTMSWCQTAQSAGAIVMHFGVGVLADRIGLGQTLLLGPISLVLILVLLISGTRGRPTALALGR